MSGDHYIEWGRITSTFLFVSHRQIAKTWLCRCRLTKKPLMVLLHHSFVRYVNAVNCLYFYVLALVLVCLCTCVCISSKPKEINRIKVISYLSPGHFIRMNERCSRKTKRTQLFWLMTSIRTDERTDTRALFARRENPVNEWMNE